MYDYQNIAKNITNNGFATIDAVFTDVQIESLLQVLSTVDTNKPTFRKTADLFAIRQFLKKYQMLYK
jgi:hypothetical protein